MASQYNNGNYTKVGPAGQKRRAPLPPPAPQAPPGNHQRPVGHGGGPSQLPQHYQQQTAALRSVPSLGQSAHYPHHSQPYQAYNEGMQHSQDVQDDYDQRDVQDAEMGSSSAAPNDVNAATGDPGQAEMLQLLRELLTIQKSQNEILFDLAIGFKSQAECQEKERVETQLVRSVNM